MDNKYSRGTSVSLLLMIFVVAIPTFAAQAKCKGNPKVIGACYFVHGRVNLGADTVRLRLWRVGTKRILGVAAGPSTDDAGDPIFPQNLRFESEDETIYGDFEVCPFTREREGAMQFVCIESASHLIVEH
jgi:hypothetical protein